MSAGNGNGSLPILPHSVDAEVGVLGGVLRGADLEDVSPTLEAADFYREAHRTIWAAVEDLRRQHVEVDALTVWERLKATGKAHVTVELLRDLALAVPSLRPSVVSAYARIVRDLALQRALARCAGEAYETACGEPMPDVAASIDAAAERLHDLSVRASGVGLTRRTLAAEYAAELDALEQRMADPSRQTGITTGMADLDRMTLGIERGDLWVVAARTSVGKSIFGMGVAVAAARAGHAVAFFSCEMAMRSLVQRFMASEGGVPLRAIRTGRDVADVDVDRLVDLAHDSRDLPLLFLDRPGVTPAQIRAECRQMRREGGLDLVVVDYMQKVRPDTPRQSREAEVAEVSGRLKDMAGELRAGVLALAQFNREGAKANRQPALHDLRESGAIEQDADVVIALHPDSGPEDNNVTAHILKGRNCELGRVELVKDGPRVRFRSREWRTYA